ncbi:MAG: hypothetical protein ACREJO_13805 [Phycisphaerales bacterium]
MGGKGEQANRRAGEQEMAGGTAPLAGVAPKRCDQFQCPFCGHHGCKCESGPYVRGNGTTRYRRCGNPRCSKRFVTLQPPGKDFENVCG